MAQFFKDPLVQIIEELNAKNSATLKRPLTVDDLVFTEVSSNEDTGAREVIAKPSGTTEYFGSIRNPGVTYKRYVGQRMFMVQPRIWGINGETYPALIARMAEMYNLPPFSIEPKAGDLTQPYDFDKSVQDQTINQSDDWLNFVMQIQFRDDSIGWTGIFPITVYNAERDLGKIIRDTELDALIYPDDTKGAVGSMSTLTYPIEFELPGSAQAIMTTVGSALADDAEDEVVKAIIEQITEYYEFNDTEAVTTSLKLTLPGSTVLSTNLGDADEPQKQVVLQMKTVTDENVMYIGKIYLNNPSFGAVSGN